MSWFEDIDYHGNKKRFSAQLSADLPKEGDTGELNMMRTSSVGSVNAISCSSASSTHNTDDEDSDVVAVSCSLKERKREANTQAEQMRRDAIKRGYEELQAVNPMIPHSPSSLKLSKAIILQKSLSYIQYTDQQRVKDQEVMEALKKEVTALHIIKKSYEQMAKTCQDSKPVNKDDISNQDKFFVFQQLLQSLFTTFNNSVDISSFERLSNCVFAWLEDHCKPSILKDLASNILLRLDANKNTHQTSA